MFVRKITYSLGWFMLGVLENYGSRRGEWIYQNILHRKKYRKFIQEREFFSRLFILAQEAHNLLRAKIGEERYIYLAELSREVVRLREADFKAITVELQKKLERMKHGI
mgnify:CR=1 FL=1